MSDEVKIRVILQIGNVDAQIGSFALDHDSWKDQVPEYLQKVVDGFTKEWEEVRRSEGS